MENVSKHVHIIHTVVRLIGSFFIGLGVIVGLREAGVIAGITPYLWPVFIFGLGIWCLVHPGREW